MSLKNFIVRCLIIPALCLVIAVLACVYLIGWEPGFVIPGAMVSAMMMAAQPLANLIVTNAK